MSFCTCLRSAAFLHVFERREDFFVQAIAPKMTAQSWWLQPCGRGSSRYSLLESWRGGAGFEICRRLVWVQEEKLKCAHVLKLHAMEWLVCCEKGR